MKPLSAIAVSISTGGRDMGATPRQTVRAPCQRVSRDRCARHEHGPAAASRPADPGRGGRGQALRVVDRRYE